MDDTGIDVKVVILGCTDVGKTSITMRYCHNSFTTPTSATIGASFLQKRVMLDQTRMTLQIWDTAGQERFRSMAPMYYRNAKAAILVFDLTDETTFVKLREWLNDLRRHVDREIVLAVVGNKCDAETTVTSEQVKEFAKEVGASVHLTSAKTGEGIEEMFANVSRRLLEKYQLDQANQRDSSTMDRNTINLMDQELTNQGGLSTGKKCC